MSDKYEEVDIKLSDVIDIDFLQELQDNFAKSMNMASITVDHEGPVTKPSNFTDFCIKYTRGSAQGFSRCNECDIKWGKLAAKKGTPVIYNCHSGLTDFAVPIMVEGKHIGSILGGQVLTHNPDEEHFRTLAMELGINENEYIEALRKIRIISPERVKAAAQLLFMVANSISEIATKNTYLTEKNKRENSLRKVFEAISGSLDSNRIKNIIVNEVAKALKPDVCFISTYDDIKDNFYIDEYSQYRSNEADKDYISLNTRTEDIKWFMDAFRNNKQISFSNVEEYIKENNLENSPVERHFKEYNIKSGYDAAISYGDQLLGYIVIQYTQNYTRLNEEDLNFLKIIASQAGIVINQANLYKQSQLQVERETLLRKINQAISSTLDIDKILDLICTEVAQLFNVQRAVIVEFPFEDDYANYIIRREYKSRQDIKSIKEVDPKGKASKYWGERLCCSDTLLAFDNISESDAPQHFKNAYTEIGVKSAIGSVVKKDKKIWGEIVLFEYDNYRHWTTEEIALLNTITNQIYISINQAELYSKTKQQSERETLLRKVLETLSSTLDNNENLSFICSEVAKLFHVQRTIIVEFYNPENYSEYNIRSEHRARADIKSIKDVAFYEQAAAYWGKTLFESSKLLIFDNIENSDAPDYFKHLYSSIGVKSAIGVMVRKGQNRWDAILLFEYDNYRHWSDEEITMLNTIANQIYISIQQSELYLTTKQQAERELLLRKITENIRSSLDVNVILNYICDELAQVFKVQRATIIQYHNNQDYSNFEVRREYKSSQDILGIVNNPSFNFKTGEIWAKVLEEEVGYLAVQNIQESDMPDFFKQNYANIGQKSILVVPIKKDAEKWGVIVLSEYSYYRQWTEDDINLLKTISNQIYIALKQSELYAKMQQQFEREKAILNNLPFMAWLKDDKGRFLAVNELFAKQCDLRAEEVLGKIDLEIYPEELAKKYIEDDINVMKTGQKIQIEEQIKGPEGIQWYETFKTPVFDNEGKIIGTTGFSRDITEQKEVDRMKNEFISIISHELRTPLTSIRGALGLVSSNALGTLPDKINSLLTIASNNTIRLINLINDILDLEKIKAGKMDFKFDEYDVMELIDESIKLNEEYARQYNVKFEVGPGLDKALINVDKDRFIQVITNLLSNAAKFSYQNGTVTVNAERKKNLVSISVTNNGNGIPEESTAKIFQSFSQVDSSDTRQKGGTGLGLSISKSITERMGGTIGFVSKVQEYTTFHIDLPEIRKHEDAKTVLICDDNKTTAFCIKSMFERLGYNVDIALCADEASKLLIENQYDLMTLDLLLPDRNGLTLLDELKSSKKTKDLPILIISVKKPDLELVKNSHQVVDWLEKSFNIEDLEQSIQKIIQNKNTNKVKILHVENDPDILKLIDLTLIDMASVTPVKSLAKASEIIKETPFDIIILDYVFPEGTSDKLIPAIKAGPNKDAKIIVFSAYEESKILSRYVDSILLKTDVSNEKFKEAIQMFIDMRQYEKEMRESSL